MRESVVDRADPADSGAGAGRVFVVALCGGGDRPIAELADRTPFEAAATPHLDELARDGCSGLLEVIRADVPPESDSGAMALLGYDPVRYYTGRGPLEGLGMDFWDADGFSVAFRINFASWQPDTGRLDRRTSRDLSDDELEALVTSVRAEVRLTDDVAVRLTGFGRHRGILALTSRTVPLSGRVTNTDPGFVALGPFGVPVADPPTTPLRCRPAPGLDGTPSGLNAEGTARLVNQFVERSAAVLENHPVNLARRAAGRRPANLILVRDGGDTLPVLPSFAAERGLRLSMYGQVPAERGLARLIGARFTVARAGPGEDDRSFYRTLLPALLDDPADVVFVHLKGPDEPGHDGRPHDKVTAIGDIDGGFVGPLRARLGPLDTLVVTCDHATPCELGIHAPDRVPTVVTGPGVRPDGVTGFGERAAAGGGLPAARASELLPWLLRLRKGR
ncbi:CMP-5'-phosphonoformate--3-phosphoglycerate phosphonoformyl transferase [Plantactinospora soyae]|uniref:2,3-bisphosphoglycerate-independent phosphoglycerate mutase n=1 Tax=Plantactinospora soyae TaxID=1544732 RepID=A0A927M8L7_9ACTN|nr:CMP-5'-phosphonoformate--3-phosphoglycerate phosphonoformyl transferase [Plantactinospora soyae]MBE1489814.1 2,3-bisphosphoglycerate-independent phosphoglycerate mutase [Plantactinospora soyae]